MRKMNLLAVLCSLMLALFAAACGTPAAGEEPSTTSTATLNAERQNLRVSASTLIQVESDLDDGASAPRASDAELQVESILAYDGNGSQIQVSDPGGTEIKCRKCYCPKNGDLCTCIDCVP